MTDSADTAPVQPVLFINPGSGGGKAQRCGLVARCRARRIEPVVMKRGDDLASLASAAALPTRSERVHSDFNEDSVKRTCPQRPPNPKNQHRGRAPPR